MFDGGGAATSKSRKSRLGPPLAPVAIARTLLVPAGTGALTETLCQVFQLAVGGKATAAATTLSLAAMPIGRPPLEPLALRARRVDLPGWAAVTVNPPSPPAL